MPADHSKLGSQHLKGINTISGCDSGISHFPNDKSPFLHPNLHVSHPKGHAHNEVKLVILCTPVVGCKESPFISEKIDECRYLVVTTSTHFIKLNYCNNTSIFKDNGDTFISKSTLILKTFF